MADQQQLTRHDNVYSNCFGSVILAKLCTAKKSRIGVFSLSTQTAQMYRLYLYICILMLLPGINGQVIFLQVCITTTYGFLLPLQTQYKQDLHIINCLICDYYRYEEEVWFPLLSQYRNYRFVGDELFLQIRLKISKRSFR